MQTNAEAQQFAATTKPEHMKQLAARVVWSASLDKYLRD